MKRIKQNTKSITYRRTYSKKSCNAIDIFVDLIKMETVKVYIDLVFNSNYKQIVINRIILLYTKLNEQTTYTNHIQLTTIDLKNIISFE